MPLTMARPGESGRIRKIGGNVIAEIKGTRVAVNRDMAAKILI